MKNGPSKSIFLETIPVIIGILIAVVISNIQQRYADRQYLKTTIKSIRTQNLENVGELQYALERQSILLDSLRALMKDDESTLFDAIGKGKGLYTPDLKSTTWQFLFENENHTLVSYDLINQLSEIEKYEGLVNGYNESVKQILFNPEVFENPKMKRILLIWLYDFMAVERDMIEELHAFDSLAANY